MLAYDIYQNVRMPKKITFKKREYFGNFFAKACQVIFGFILQSVNSSN